MSGGNGTTARWAAVLAAVVGGLWAGPARAGDDDIPIDKLPAAVKKAIDAAVPKAKWTTAGKSEEDKKVSYEIEGEDAKGRYVWVEVTAEGKVVEVQTEVPLKDAPKVVADALTKQFPRFKVETTYEVQVDGKVARYDFEGKRPKDKEEITISVSADGKTIDVYDE